MTKKILSVFLAALMVFSMVPFAGLTAFAGDIPVPHTHAFEYTATGATLTATCTEGCDKNYDTTPLTLTLTEDGFDETALNTWKDAGATEPVITYYAASDTELTTPIDKPTEPGKYKVQAVVGSKTAELAFSIADPANITWDYDEGTKTLTLGNDSDAYPFSEGNWSDKEVDKVVVASPIAPVSMASWFKGVKEFTGLDKIITDKVTDMTGLFEGSTVSELDISAWKISQVCVVDDMFKDCSNLKKLTSPCAVLPLPAAPSGKGWINTPGGEALTSTVAAGGCYQIMYLKNNAAAYKLTYKSKNQSEEVLVGYDTAKKAYSTSLSCDFRTQASNLVGWKDRDGVCYADKEEINLEKDTIVTAMWAPTVAWDMRYHTEVVKENTDYTLSDGVLTLLKDDIIVLGTLDGIVIRVADNVKNFFISDVTVNGTDGSDEPLIRVDNSQEVTITVMGENELNAGQGQPAIVGNYLIIKATEEAGTLNINTENASAIETDYLNMDGKNLEVNITDSAELSSKSAILVKSDRSEFKISGCSVNVEHNADADAVAVKAANELTLQDSAALTVTESGNAQAAKAITVSVNGTSELTAQSNTATAISTAAFKVDVNSKTDIRSNDSYAADCTGNFIVSGKVNLEKALSVSFFTGNNTLSPVRADAIKTDNVTGADDKEFGFYYGAEKLSFDEDTKTLLAQEDKIPDCVKLAVRGFTVKYMYDGVEVGTETVSAGSHITPPSDYYFSNESDYYRCITEDININVGWCGYSGSSFSENYMPTPTRWFYYQYNTSENAGYVFDKIGWDYTGDYTFINNNGAVVRKYDEANSTALGINKYNYTPVPLSELHEMKGVWYITEDVQLDNLVISAEGATLVLREGAHLTVNGSDATADSAATPAITSTNDTSILQIAYVMDRYNDVLSQEQMEKYDASVTFVGGDGNEKFPIGACGANLPNYSQFIGTVNVEPGKSVGGNEPNFAVIGKNIEVGGGILNAVGTSGSTESGGIKADLVHVDLMGIINAKGAKGDVDSRAIVADKVLLTSTRDKVNENYTGATLNAQASGTAYAIESDHIVFEGEAKFSAVGGDGVTKNSLSSLPLFDDPKVKTHENAPGAYGNHGYADFDLANLCAGDYPGRHITGGAGAEPYTLTRTSDIPCFPSPVKYISFETIPHAMMFAALSGHDEERDSYVAKIVAHCVNCPLAPDEDVSDYTFECDADKTLYNNSKNYDNVWCLNCAGQIEYAVFEQQDEFDGEAKKTAICVQSRRDSSHKAGTIISDSVTEPYKYPMGYNVDQAWSRAVGYSQKGAKFNDKEFSLTPKIAEKRATDGKELTSFVKPGTCYVTVSLDYLAGNTTFTKKTLSTEDEFVEHEISKGKQEMDTAADAVICMTDVNDGVDPWAKKWVFFKTDTVNTPCLGETKGDTTTVDQESEKIQAGDITYTVTAGEDYVKVEDGKLYPIKPGTATVSVVRAATDWYEEAQAELTVKVDEKAVAKPTIKPTLYQYTTDENGAPVSKEQTLTADSEQWEGTFDKAIMEIVAGDTVKEAGSYEVTVKLKNEASAAYPGYKIDEIYRWEEDATGETPSTQVEWVVNKAPAYEYFTRTVSGDDIKIPNRVGSTVSFDIPEKVPVKPEGEAYAATTFTAGTCSLNKVTGAIADGKLQLTVGSNHIVKTDGNAFTAKLKVSSNNFIDYTVEYTVTPIYHTHEYESAFVEDNNTALKVSCNSTTDFECFCKNPITIAIDYPEGANESHEIPYTASPILCKCDAATWEAGYEDTATNYIKYYEHKDGSYVEMTEGQPTIVGTYKAELYIGGKSVEVVYKIIPANVVFNEQPTATVTYGDEVTDGVIKGSMKSAVNGIAVEATETSFTWNSDESYGDAGTKERFATFKPKDTHNFNVNYNVAVTLTVNKANATEEMKAASLNSINNRVGSKAELDLKDKLPKGAEFGTPTVQNNIATASIDDNKLSLEIIGSHAAIEQFTVEVPVNNATNYKDYDIEVTVDVLFHTHNFAYSMVDNAIIATCDSTSDFNCYLASENGTVGNILTLTLNANPNGKDSTTVVYTGEPVKFSLNAAQAALWKTETGEDPTLTKVTYTAKEGSLLNENDEAVDVGSYTASYTLHEKTISIDFKIIKADVEVDTLKDVTVTYGTAVSNDVIKGTMKSAETGKAVPGKFTWNNLETYDDAQTEKKSFTATFTPADTKNFNKKNDIDVNVKVNKTAATEEMKAAESRILNRAGSTAELDLKDKLPAGASFGTVTVVPEGIATASIVDKVLKLQIAGTDLTDDNNPFEVKVAVKDATNYVDYEIIVTVDVYFHAHEFDTAYTFDENNHWHRCIEENCYIEDYSTCGLEKVAYGEHIGMEDYICDVCGYENIPACKEAAIKLVRAALPRNTNHKQQEIADKAIADIENAERVASINEITAKAVDDVAKNAIRCPLCDRYEAQKDVPFYGFILSIVHTFVHLAFSIGRIS